jgi:hypothetical protein
LHTKYKPVEEAVTILLKSSNWKKILKLSILLKESPQVIENQLKPALKLAANLKMNWLRERVVDFLGKQTRLADVQEQKKHMPVLFSEGGLVETNDSDILSEASDVSGKSSITGKSFLSSGSKKSGKKPKDLVKRKVKEGSMFEEEFLVEYLDKAKLQRDDVGNQSSCGNANSYAA